MVDKCQVGSHLAVLAWLGIEDHYPPTIVNDVTSHLRLPPWHVVLLMVVWAWAALGFAFFAVYRHSTSHWGMMAVSLFLIIALWKAWRIGFWMSALGMGAGIGGQLARISAVDTPPVGLFISVAIGVICLLVQQTPKNLSWFKFPNTRSTRLAFWLITAIVCVVAEFWLFRRLPKNL